MSHKDDVFIRVFIGVLLGLTVFTIAIIILANSVARQVVQDPVRGPTGVSAIEERIRPIGQVRVAGRAPPAPAVAAAPVARSGEEVSQAACNACHVTGAAGAPKIGVKDQWAARLGKGMETLVNHAINGFQAMPAKGGNPTLSDEDVKKAVIYMLEQVGFSGEGPGPTSAAPAPAPTVAGYADDGQQIYTTACAACHATGAAGAPRVGDTGAWDARIAQGMNALHEHAIVGFKAMPAKGGRLDLSDGAVRAAVVYMVENSR